MEWAGAAEDLSIYTFSKPFQQNGAFGWGPVALGGEWAQLTSNVQQMFDDLMEIIDEEACGGDGEEEEEGALLLPVPGLLDSIDAGRGYAFAHNHFESCLGPSCVWMQTPHGGVPVHPNAPQPSHPEQRALYAPIYSWEDQVCLPGWQ